MTITLSHEQAIALVEVIELQLAAIENAIEALSDIGNKREMLDQLQWDYEQLETILELF